MENANAFHFWHTHSNSRFVPVHLFPAMPGNACMYHTHTCKKQTNSKIYCERTSECTWVIRKFEMHCHSFQWSASNSMIYGLEVGITTPKETVSTGILSLFWCIYTMKNEHVHLLWHTHSNSRHVPVHVLSCYDGENVYTYHIYIFMFLITTQLKKAIKLKGSLPTQFWMHLINQ